MENMLKYNIPVKTDEKFGLRFKVAIREKVLPDLRNTDMSSPGAYLFLWENGKVLKEYQVHYITDGSGVYEDPSGKYLLKRGSLVITRPGVWHRYSPCPDNGWVENFLGLKWALAENVLDQILLYRKKPVFEIGIREDLLDTYHQIFELSINVGTITQQRITGLIMRLFGVILTNSEKDEDSLQSLECIIQQTCFHIKRNVDKSIDFKSIASDNNLGYEHFRKIFKQIVGMPPGQYHLNLKIKTARKMLLATNKSVKEISYDLGFDSVYYFCRLFKKKMGITP